jgi:RHS repeat-associated protein
MSYGQNNIPMQLLWYKSSCVNVAGTPVDIRVDIAFASSTLPGYTYELYENVGNANPVTNPSLSNTDPNYITSETSAAGAVNGSIDALFTGVAVYQQSYYVKVFETNNPVVSKTLLIMVDRTLNPIFSTYTYATYANGLEVHTDPLGCSSGASSMQAGIEGGASEYLWTSSTGGAISNPTINNPVLDIYDNSSQLQVYSVKVSDASGCVEVINNITYNPPVPPTNFTVKILPFSDNTYTECANIQATIANINTTHSGFIYQWYSIDGQLVQSDSRPKVDFLEAESEYYVKILSYHGCLLQTLPVFQTPPAIRHTFSNVTGDPCFGGSASQITLEALWGNAPYEYTISHNSQSNCSVTISNAANLVTISSINCNGVITSGLEVGYYTVTVKDHLGCIFEKTILVGREANDLELSIDIQFEECGASNGSFMIQPSDPNYSGPQLDYQWELVGGSNPPDLAPSFGNAGCQVLGLSAGTYSVTISEGYWTNYCQKVETIIIENEGIAISSIQTTASQGVGLGSIVINTTGANPQDINFSWVAPNTSNPFQVEEFDGDGLFALEELSAGTYTITLIHEGCTLVQTIVIPSCDLSVSSTVTGEFCSWGNGRIALTTMESGTDVTGLVNYEWEQLTPNQQYLSSTTSGISDLEAGDYRVTVTYGDCIVVEEITVETVTLPDIDNLGSSYCDAENGRMYYGLHLSSIQASAHVFTIIPNSFPPNTVVTQGSNGTYVDINATYLPPDSYKLIVELTSANGQNTCEVRLPFVIGKNTDPPTYTISTETALCDKNGAASIQLAGPIGVWQPTYNWTTLPPLGAASFIGSNFSNLDAGDYEIDIVYHPLYTACNSTQTITIPNLQPTIQVAIQNEGCGGVGELTATTNLIGTIHPYSYTLIDDNTGLTLNQSSSGYFPNLAPGEYRVRLNTGIPGCAPADAIVTIDHSELVALNQVNATCGQGGELQIDLQNQSGVSLSADPSDFTWVDNQTAAIISGATIQNLAPGSYTVTVTQPNGLPCVGTYLVIDNPLSLVTETLVHDCDGNASGAITLSVTDPSASYLWKKENGHFVIGGNTISNLAVGEYTVTITGSNNSDGTCVLYRSYTIHGGFDLTLNATQSTCSGEDNGKIQAIITNTNAPIISYNWADVTLGILPFYGPQLSNLASGNYGLLVADANGCTKSAFEVIAPIQAMDITTFAVNTNPSLKCALDVVFAGGVAPYTVSLELLQEGVDNQGVPMILGAVVNQSIPANTDNTLYTLNNLPPGLYGVVVRDDNGCEVSSADLGLGNIRISPATTAIPTMYFRWKELNATSAPGEISISETQRKAKVIADNMETQIKAAMDDMGDALNAQTCDKVTDIADETKLSYDLQYHHYTLYYYNRRGELTRTVPPAGVDFLDATEITEHKTYRTTVNGILPTKELPNHTLVTTYHYDAAGRSIESVSPDAGLVEQAFRSDGLVRFSQDARQKDFVTERMTYIKYDGLNRVVEQGEMDVPNGVYATYITGQGQTDMNTFDFPQDIPAINKTEWVRTHYSDKHIISNSPTVNISYHGLGIQEQRYLRNRVSYTEAWNGGSNVNAITTTTYSYDPHGNVEWIRTYIPGLGDNYIRLEYDLISRNVNKVCYNEFAIDRFYHRYEYDEQNRIVNAETSRDDIVWDSDARYAYYEHGPLKRKEIGEDKIQGIDYTYTIHGWLKTINHPYLNKYENANSNTTNNQLNDPGQDGYSSSPNNEVQKDVWGFSLGYYQGDYARQSTNGTGGYNSINEGINYNSQELYNGNITYWSNGTTENSLTLGDQEKLTQRSFNYDNLNRILGSELSIVNLGNTPTFGAVNNQFRTAYTYDANGNIKTLQRYDGTSAGQLIDDISYQYNVNGAGKLENNQLATIKDAVGTTANLGDIDDQSYAYDARGSIIQIIESNNNNRTTDITWLNTGKVKTVSIKESGTEISHLEYLYDATGNRVAKVWKEDVNKPLTWNHTYYVSDASGNKMSIYNRGYEFTAGSRLNPYRTYYDIKEQLLYGSDRIGSINNNTRLFTNNYTDLSTAESYAGWDINTKLNNTSTSSFDFGKRVLGVKEYDLVDHLGNVTTQISDRKAGTLATGNIKAKILSYQQYYPFGWNMPGRSLNEDKARFDFQRQESDKEWLGGNAVAFKYRFHDPRLGRFISVDPLMASYPHNSSYAFSENFVINGIELEGLELTIPRSGGFYIPRPTITLPRLPRVPVRPIPPIPISPSMPKGLNVPNAPTAPEMKLDVPQMKLEEIDWENNPPLNPEELGDGWENVTHPDNKKGGGKEFMNEKGEKVRFDPGKPGKPGFEGKDHWHRYNPNWTKDMKKNGLYLDKYGSPVRKGSNASHIEPNQSLPTVTITPEFVDKRNQYKKNLKQYKKQYKKAMKEYRQEMKKHNDMLKWSGDYKEA